MVFQTIREQDYSYLSYDSVREWKRDIKCAKVDAEKQLYHVYNLDYRGRVYTTAHRLDPQGDDVSRALLTFSDPVKINERGWYWLRVHTVAIWQGRRNSSEHEWIPEKGMTPDVQVMKMKAVEEVYIHKKNILKNLI